MSGLFSLLGWSRGSGRRPGPGGGWLWGRRNVRGIWLPGHGRPRAKLRRRPWGASPTQDSGPHAAGSTRGLSIPILSGSSFSHFCGLGWTLRSMRTPPGPSEDSPHLKRSPGPFTHTPPHPRAPSTTARLLPLWTSRSAFCVVWVTHTAPVPPCSLPSLTHVPGHPCTSILSASLFMTK